MVAEKKFPESNTTIKGKITNNIDIACSFKKPLYKLEDLVTVTATVAAKNFAQEDRSFKHGVQLDINL